MSGASGKAVARMDQPFDHWLHKQLHEMYDAIASEPLPDDLMKLIDDDADSASRNPLDKGSPEDPDRDND